MFRDDFVWGVAASAYQIEGREEGDGAGKMIWDTFAEQGRIMDGYTADVTCAHATHYKEDYALMKNLGIKAYRFSISWARLMPEGTGRVNEKAVALYRDMIAEMKKNGVTPYLTMYHWELPQALQDKGGWLNPQIVDWFGEYAKVVAENFSDICEYIITLNEPQCFVGLGHLSGVQAPGLKLSLPETFQIAHNALKAHGQAVINLRKYAKADIKVGYAPTCGVAYPATDSPEDIEAAREYYFTQNNPMDNWTWNVAWFSDPVFLGRYPEDGLKKYAQWLPEITEEDMKLISQPLDFMGQNIYNGYMIRRGADGSCEYVNRPLGANKAATGWPVTPECLYWGIKFLYDRYHLPIYITENGMSCHDSISADGRVHDPDRINFLDLYLSALQKAADEGADVRGYFLWTFLDNFEWEKGYTERFGIVHVDFATQRRRVKDSAYWYKKVMESNGKILSINQPKREILFMEPQFKQMIWGGNKLRTEWSYNIPGDDTGECWAVSAHPNGDCKVASGAYTGKTLSQLWTEVPQLFDNVDEAGKIVEDKFPLLIKIIDAKADLSIQVHPDDSYAKVHENGSFGKTECWYILDCPEDATLVIGHKAKSPEEMEEMVRGGRWSEFLQEVPVKKGDFIQINPGTLHAIKGGIMLLETQQNSDITYRVYDYDRLSDGKPRPLHVEQSLAVTTAPATPVEECIFHTESGADNEMQILMENQYYQVSRMQVRGKANWVQEKGFRIVTVLEGYGMINGTAVKKGEHFILPDSFGEVTAEGDMLLFMSTKGTKK